MKRTPPPRTGRRNRESEKDVECVTITGMDVDQENSQHEHHSNSTPSTEDPFLKMQMFMEAQFRTTNEGIAKINSTVAKMNDKIGVNARNLSRLKKTVEDNADYTAQELAKIQKDAEERDKQRAEEIAELKLALKRHQTVSEKGQAEVENIKSVIHNRLPSSGARCSETDSEYNKARRSLRLWPIEETQETQLPDSVEHFILEMLRVPRSDFSMEDVETMVRVVPKRRRNKENDNDKHEVCVRFKAINTRDRIIGHSFNLASFVDEENKPTAGVRLEIPENLRGMFSRLPGLWELPENKARGRL